MVVACMNRLVTLVLILRGPFRCTSRRNRQRWLHCKNTAHRSVDPLPGGEPASVADFKIKIKIKIKRTQVCRGHARI